MDAVKFIKERNRMCTTYTPKRCEGCPADNYGGEGVACIMVDKIDAERLVPIVEKWSAAHPRKTRQSVFLEQWPETKVDDAGTILVMPCTLLPSLCCSSYCGGHENCIVCRREFWMQEVE